MASLARQLRCDHRAVFTTTYLVLTEVLRTTLRQHRGLFSDQRWVIGEDWRFADLYFRAFNAYRQRRATPEAWRIAFDSAASSEANALQDMLLGINAHVQRDLPYAIVAAGLRTRAGASRKPDHDRLNRVLALAFARVLRAVGRRYDPTLLALITPSAKAAALTLVDGWREVAWRNAERLAAARTKTARRLVRAAIDANATAEARALAGAPGVPGTRAARDAFCRLHMPHASHRPG